MLVQRVLTALVLAPLTVCAVLYFPPVATFILFCLVLGAAILEWAKLTHRSATTTTVLVLTFFALASGLHWSGFQATFVLPVLIGANIVWTIISLYVIHAKRTERKDLDGIVGRFLQGPVICLVLVLAALIGTAKLLYLDPVLLLLVFAVVWGADIGAYFSGKRWGRRKLAATISPGKSWEGVVGGIATSGLILVLATNWMILSANQRVSLILLGVFAACMSVFGDLFESLLKRTGGFKDSGNILPGHGGILDRIDGLIAAIPIYSLGVFLWVSKL